MALRDYCKTVLYCEINDYCRKVLTHRMTDGLLDEAPIWEDIKTLNYEGNHVDIITGGFPCQNISVAGNGKGLAGEQSGLFYELLRVCSDIKPRWIFLENVPAITTRGGTEVVREIAKMGYDLRWCVISASGLGALHRRERWFLLAHSTSQEPNGFSEREEKTHPLFTYSGIDGHSDSLTSREAYKEAKPFQSKQTTRGRSTGLYWPFESRTHWQKTLGEVGKCIDGVSAKLDFNTEQLRSLGNAVVPVQARTAFEILMGIKDKTYERKGMRR